MHHLLSVKPHSYQLSLQRAVDFENGYLSWREKRNALGIKWPLIITYNIAL